MVRECVFISTNSFFLYINLLCLLDSLFASACILHFPFILGVVMIYFTYIHTYDCCVLLLIQVFHFQIYIYVGMFKLYYLVLVKSKIGNRKCAH